MPTQLMKDTYWELWALQRTHFRRCLEVARGLIDHPTQAQVLHALSVRQGCTQRQLADQMRVRPSTMAVTLGRMERSGLVQRSHNPLDARAMQVTLTPRGADVYRQIMGQMQRVMDACFEGMSPEQVAELNSLVRRVHANLNRDLAGGGEELEGGCNR